MLVLVIILIVAVPIIPGLVISRKQRGIDRRHFAAFVGYVAAVVAIASLLLLFLAAQFPYPSTARQASGFVLGIIGLIAWLVVLLAGLFSGGVQRFLLLLYGMAMAFTYLLVAAANFGS
jgi:hypothetical protein